jgi:hypothetical protein
MKKLFVLVLTVAIAMIFAACESREERELRNAIDAAERAEENYQRAVDDYNELQRDIDNYNSALERVQNAK